MSGIRRVRVWSVPLRLVHWLLALCLLALLVSGWVAGPRLADAGPWRDLHLTASYLLAIGLVVRLALLFRGRTPTDRWRDLLPTSRQQWQGVRDMARFYVSLGRAPLPGYYGHNPLWGPVYLALFGLLAVALASGVALAGADRPSLLTLAATPGWLGWTLPEWHAGSARALAGAGVAHLLAVFWHDARGTASEISALVNGHKIFLAARDPRELVERLSIHPVRRHDPGQR